VPHPRARARSRGSPIVRRVRAGGEGAGVLSTSRGATTPSGIEQQIPKIECRIRQRSLSIVDLGLSQDPVRQQHLVRQLKRCFHVSRPGVAASNDPSDALVANVYQTEAVK